MSTDTDASAIPDVSSLLWTVEQTADACGVHPVTVQRLVARNEIASLMFNKRRLIPARAIVQFYADVLNEPSTRDAVIARLSAKAEQYGKAPFNFEPVHSYFEVDGVTVVH